MASIERETIITASPATVWDAVRDFGALHRRVAPGLVIDTVVEAGSEPPVRLVTFANGTIVRETIVASDDAARRLVWTISGAPVTHHNGALQVHADGAAGSRVVWTADVLPHALAEPFGTLMTQGLAVMAAHLGK